MAASMFCGCWSGFGHCCRTPAAEEQFDDVSDLLPISPFAGANLDLDKSRDQPRAIDLG